MSRRLESLAPGLKSGEPIERQWFPDEAAFIAAVRRIVYLSVEYVRIVDGLPSAFPESERQSGGERG